jgi:hypothetical protein
MKNLNEPLENGLIPIVEIAKIIYKYDDTEPNFVDFNKPEFKDNKLFVGFYGDKNGTGITKYLYFEDGQFKLIIYDIYWTCSYISRVHTEVIKYNPIKLIKKLVELGVTTYDELGYGDDPHLDIITEEQYKEAKRIVKEYEQQINMVVNNCKECGTILINEESGYCKECFYKDRYKYD